MESVYDLTDSLYRQGWEHAESVDDYFYGDFPVLEMKHQVYAMTAMRRYVAKSLSTCETSTQTGEVCPSSWAAQNTVLTVTVRQQNNSRDFEQQ